MFIPVDAAVVRDIVLVALLVRHVDIVRWWIGASLRSRQQVENMPLST